MTDVTPKESFHEKAPLVDVDELVGLVVDGMMTDGLRERAGSVWIQSSFADPEREIDTKETLSDLDLFVVVPDWEYPAVDSGLALVAPEAEVPAAYEESREGKDWTSKGGKCDSPEEAWEMIPGWARETLSQSLEYGFYATESDVESGSVRSYDLTIDNRDVFERVREPDAEFCLWRDDS